MNQEHEIKMLALLSKRHNVSFAELETAMEYRPSFFDLASIPSLAQRTYDESGLQSVVIDNLMLLKTSTDTAVWLDISTLSELTHHHLQRMLHNEQELPVDWLLAHAERDNTLVRNAPTAWNRLMLNDHYVDEMPPILRTVLTELIQLPQEFKNLQNLLDAAAYLTQNCTPVPPVELTTTDQTTTERDDHERRARITPPAAKNTILPKAGTTTRL